MHNLLAIYIWFLLLGGLTAVVIEFRGDMRLGRHNQLPAWKTTWLDFGLIVWWVLASAIVAQGVSDYILKALYVGGDPPKTLVALVVGTSSHLAALFVFYLCYKYYDLADTLVINSKKPKCATWFKYLVSLLLSGILLSIMAGKGWEALLHFMHSANLTPSSQPQKLVTLFQTSAINWTSIALIILAIFVAPISEELLFRVLIYRFLKGRFTPLFALIISSLLFALLHFNVFSFLPLFLLGMLLCRAYEKTGNIYTCIAFHALFNANNIFLLFLQVKAG